VTAWLAFTIVFSFGIEYRIPQIQTVESNSLAAKAGIMPADQWLSIAGHSTDSWEDVGQGLIINWGEKNIPVSVKNSSGEVKQTFLDLSQIQFSAHSNSLLTSIGVSPNKSAEKHKIQSPSFFAAMTTAGVKILDLVSILLLTLKQVLIGVIPISVLLGPIGLLATSVASLTQGIMVFSYFIATLSVAVALLNLFPIPGLDGGAIIYALIEKIRGKPISVALEILIYRLMLVVLFLLLVQLVKNDVASFFLRPAA
jgi:regulator of sigma E protease